MLMASNCLQVTAGSAAFIFDFNSEKPRLIKSKVHMHLIGDPQKYIESGILIKKHTAARPIKMGREAHETLRVSTLETNAQANIVFSRQSKHLSHDRFD